MNPANMLWTHDQLFLQGGHSHGVTECSGLESSKVMTPMSSHAHQHHEDNHNHSTHFLKTLKDALENLEEEDDRAGGDENQQERNGDDHGHTHTEQDHNDHEHQHYDNFNDGNSDNNLWIIKIVFKYLNNKWIIILFAYLRQVHQATDS